MADENTNTPEVWLPIPTWESVYEVSSLGRVRVARTKRIRKATITQGGYLRMGLYKKSEAGVKRREYRAVHRLVALAFLGPPPTVRQVNHKDGNKLNNRVDNLEWATSAENMRHAVEHGLQVHGERVNTAKLTAEQVKEIRRLRACGHKNSALAATYGVSYYTIWDITTGKSWKHIPSP